MSRDDPTKPPSTGKPTATATDPAPRNAATRLPPPGRGPRKLDAAAIRDAYARASAAMARVAPTAPGYRLFWVSGRSIGWMDLPVGGKYAILGRHTECDAVLDGDAALSLRHILAMTVALADGMALRLLDLQTAVPFHLEDGVPRRSIVASGPIAIALGEHVIGGVPMEEGARPGALRLAATPLRPPLVTESSSVPRSLHPEGPREARVRLPSAPGEDGPRSRVTSIPPSIPISDLPKRRTAGERAASGLSAALAPGLGGQGKPCATITLRREGRAASVELTEEELDLGVMIGRAERCYDAGLRAVLDTNTSRGHLLLLHHGGAFEAFDLCSTQGTFVDGQRVRRLALDGEGATLQLAAHNPVTLEWRYCVP